MSGLSYHRVAPGTRAASLRQHCGYAGFWMRIMIWATRHSLRS